jgi:hypothetical protein
MLVANEFSGTINKYTLGTVTNLCCRYLYFFALSGLQS